MKTAQCKYTQAGINITLGVYFDSKAFEIMPPMGKDEEEDFIRLTCDSLAAAMPKESVEKNFYIKRVIKNPETNLIKILGTDGFLIDSALVIPSSQQAYAKERIKISDLDQLPARLKFSIELLKSINDRLPLYEEEVKKELSSAKITVTKEAIKQEIPIVKREFVPDKAFDVFAEITHAKKEIKELTDNSSKVLNSIMTQVDNTQKRIHDEVMKEAAQGLQFEDNKKKLEEFALGITSKSGGIDVEKVKEAITNKINEITPIYPKFANDLDEISQRITKQTDLLVLCKKHLINALYESAKQYYDVIVKQMQSAGPLAKKSMAADFNRKFLEIASISENDKLSSMDKAQDHLSKLSFEDLQKIISNDEKDNPGLLQKCNTSWTEESPELQIVIKNLSQLNKILSPLFKDDPQFSEYANQDMVEIIRIPFPRSFQFKFSRNAINYKNAVDDFCKAQKETIISMVNNYKKIIQIDTVRDKAQRELAETQRQTNLLKKPVTEYKDLLILKEKSGAIIAAANDQHEITEKHLNSANKLYDLMAGKIDPSLKKLIKKVSVIIQKIRTDAEDANKNLKSLMEKKAQIDLNINKQPTEKSNPAELNKKIEAMEMEKNDLIEKNNNIQSLSNQLSGYDSILKINEGTDLTTIQADINKLRDEAKGFLLQLIKNQTLDPAKAEQLKKQMVELYTHVDTNVASIDKIINEISNVQKQILTDLNTKSDAPTEELESSMQTISDKMQALEIAKLKVNENVSELRKLSNESLK